MNHFESLVINLIWTKKLVLLYYLESLLYIIFKEPLPNKAQLSEAGNPYWREVSAQLTSLYRLAAFDITIIIHFFYKTSSLHVCVDV